MALSPGRSRLELPAHLNDMLSWDSDSLPNDGTLTQSTADAWQQATSMAQQDIHRKSLPLLRSQSESNPVITFTTSAGTSGLLQEVDQADTPSHQAQLTVSPIGKTGTQDVTQGFSSISSPSPSSSTAPGPSISIERRSPSANNTQHSLFSALRPSSPKVSLPNQSSTSVQGREEPSNPNSHIVRRGVDREREFSLSGSDTSTKNRRPSSVFEHVNGMLDRFGRRLHSRGDSKEDRKQLTASMASLGGSALETGAESGSSIDDHSPNGSSTHMSPTAPTSMSSWERSSGGAALDSASAVEAGGGGGSTRAGLAWSPILDEGDKSRPSMQRGQSASGSMDGARLSGYSLSQNQSRRGSVMERTLVQVTEDNERFSVVDISGLNSAAAVKERMMSKLHLFDDDPSCFAVSRTEIGMSGPGGPQMSNDELLALCWQSGDDKGTLKFLLQQIAPPSHANQSMIPPPPSGHFPTQVAGSGRRGSFNDSGVASSRSGNQSPSNAHLRDGHSKTTSLSSRSSVGDAFTYAENNGACDSGSEASARNGAVPLQRSKPSDWRAEGASSATSPEDVRSPGASARSPSHQSTPLASISTQQRGSREMEGKFGTTTRPGRNERAEKRPGQSPLHSPVEELQEIDANLFAARPGQMRNNKDRPSSSHAAFRSGLHGQWESEGGASSRPSAASSPLSTHTALSERSGSISNRSSHPPLNDLPKSLQPGKKATLDAADAAHMYLARAPSPVDRQTNHQIHHQLPAGVHNVRSVDDMRRGARPIMPSLGEMVHPSRQSPNFSQSFSHARPSPNRGPVGIDRQASADATLGQRPGNFVDPRSNALAGVMPRPRLSVGSERDRALSFSSIGVPLSQTQRPPPPSMMPRPSGGHPGFEVARSSPAGRPGMIPTSPMPRPMTPNPMHPHPFDTRYAPPPQQSPRNPQHFPHDYGVRSPGHAPVPPPTFHHHPPATDPRMMSPPFASSRPHTLHEMQRYRPITLPGGQPRPNITSQVPREDPRFPASSSRLVSEFQRNPSSALHPGMTVQETMQLQRQQQQQQQHHHHQQMVPASQRAPPGWQQYGQGGAQAAHSASRPGPPPQSAPHPYQVGVDPMSSYQPPLRQQAAPIQRPHTAAPDAPQTERSSGSSFTTLSSVTSNHRRNLSSEHATGEPYSAPTSARSSRSESMGQEGKVSALPALCIQAEEESELPYSFETGSRRKNLLEDEDLLNLRPLPRVPATAPEAGKGADVGSGSKKKDEDTLRAAEWSRVLQSLEPTDGKRNELGSPKADPHSDLLSPKRSETNESESSSTSHATAVPPPDQRALLEAADNEGGTFNSFATFEDEDEYDEGGTWAKPLDSLNPSKDIARPLSASPPSAESTLRPGDGIANKTLHGEKVDGTDSPRRPVLTLSIYQNGQEGPIRADRTPLSPTSRPLPSISTLHAGSSSTASPQPNPLLALPSPAASGVNRRTSFARRDNDWAFRPPPEQLYDRLDDFFPKHDLDKPVLDNSAALPSSPQAESPKSEAPVSATPISASRQRFQHKKSIRLVAQDRQRFLEKAEVAERRRAEDEGLNRRRSTKLWGTKVVEVTPGAATLTSSTSTAVSDSPFGDHSAKPIFKWVKGDLIGKGTYGRVYLALNATTGEMIAVKQVELPTTDSDREDARQKGVVSALKSEIETLKDLDHPNIVSYLGFEETTSYLSIFLEYVPGGSVGSCLRKHGKLDEATIKSFLQQILVGLNYLHNRGILHRDLKADNLLVDFDGNVKISDFGTVRKSEDIYGNIASMSIQGSIFWMAPEVVSLSRAGYSAKVDIWSLGCVVLEMFAGRRPWSDEEAVQAMFKIGAERRAPPIPPDVRLTRFAAHFLKTCFAVDPASRPTAQRLLEHVFPHVLPGWKFSDSSLYRALHR